MHGNGQVNGGRESSRQREPESGHRSGKGTRWQELRELTVWEAWAGRGQGATGHLGLEATVPIED